MSASPRSSRARRLPEDGTMRQMIFLTFGSGPPTQASLRSSTTSVPATQLATL
jgi:hypothetical protein